MHDQFALHCYISGKVQGVWFRVSAQEQAQALGVTGWTRNLPDGRVEVLACGEREKLELLLVWLKRGPDLARVDEVIHKEVPWQEHSRFAIK